MVKSHYYKHIFRSWHKSHNCATFFFNYGKCRTTRNYNYEIKVVLICLHSVEELKIRHSHVVTFHFILCWRVDSTRPTRRVWDHWSAWERGSTRQTERSESEKQVRRDETDEKMSAQWISSNRCRRERREASRTTLRPHKCWISSFYGPVLRDIPTLSGYFV